jgi:tetratricopeptide (TPR) repeat protein
MKKPWDESKKTEIKEILSRIASFAKQGDAKAVEDLYLLAWDKVPEPKSAWSDSQALLLHILHYYLRKEQAKKCLPYLDILRDLYPEGEKDGTVAIYFGIINYEVGNYDKAFSFFDFLFKKYKSRPFQGRDKKYLEFYMTEAKKRLVK